MTNRFRVRFAEVALFDVESILEYIAVHDSAASAVYVHDKLLAQIDTLTEHPERGRVVPELKEMGISEFRELIWKPYRICYSIHKQEVVMPYVQSFRGLGFGWG